MTASRSAAPLTCATLACTLLLWACSPFSSDAPPVADSTLVGVLTELHLATERIEVDSSFAPGGRDSILARHGLTRDTLDATFDYYSRHPEAYDDLYDAVVDSLSAFRSRLESGPVTDEDETTPADSVASPPVDASPVPDSTASPRTGTPTTETPLPSP